MELGKLGIIVEALIEKIDADRRKLNDALEDVKVLEEDLNMLEDQIEAKTAIIKQLAAELKAKKAKPKPKVKAKVTSKSFKGVTGATYRPITPKEIIKVMVPKVPKKKAKTRH